MNYLILSDTEILSDIGKQLDKLRIQKNMTMDELSQRSGISSRTLSRIFNGGTNPSLTNIIKIYRGFGELEQLQSFFETKEPRSIINKTHNEKQRVRKPKKLDVLKRTIWEAKGKGDK